MKNLARGLWKYRQGMDGLSLRLAAILWLALLVVPTDVALGCPMCAAAVDGSSDPLATGLNVSIFFLMSMPFILTGTVGGWFFLLYRRSRRHVPSLRLVETAKEGTP